jgi:hypothetical protein
MVFPLRRAAPISQLRLDWQTKDETDTPLDGCPPSADSRFSPTGNWDCGYGVLRVDLVPTGGALNAQQLQNNTMTAFFVPLSSGGQSFVNFAPGGGSSPIGASCDNSDCSMEIRGLGANDYHLRVSSLYKNVSLQVSAQNGGDSVGLTGAQALIDSTGKAQDVLRRIQVFLPLDPASRHSDYAIQSTDSICKRYVVMTGYFESLANASSMTSNPLCE